MPYLICIAVFLILIIGCVKKQDNQSQSIKSPKTYITNSSDSNEPALIIDVRTSQEYSSGHIEGAINIPYTEIAKKIENYTNDKNQKILLYCLSGSRSGIALNTLKKLGYTNLENVGSYKDAKARFK